MKVNKEKLDQFMAVYSKKLEYAVKTFPKQYGFAIDFVPKVVEKMRIAVERNTFNHDGRAFELTCKELNIKYNIKSIDEFLERMYDDNHALV